MLACKLVKEGKFDRLNNAKLSEKGSFCSPPERVGKGIRLEADRREVKKKKIVKSMKKKSKVGEEEISNWIINVKVERLLPICNGEEGNLGSFEGL